MESRKNHPSPNDTFASCLRRLRRRLDAKQLWLSREVGCTDAAVSRWEKGDRLPRQDTVELFVEALKKEGAMPGEIVLLRMRWQKEALRRILRARAA